MKKRRKQTRIREYRPNISGKASQRVIKAMKQVTKLKKSRAKLHKGITRQGDQWAQGRITYKAIRPFLPLEYVDRWLAVAQGGVDLVSALGESKEDFMARVEKLVKPYVLYSPYIVKHAPITEFRALKYHSNAANCALLLPGPNATAGGSNDHNGVDNEDKGEGESEAEEDDIDPIDPSLLAAVKQTGNEDAIDIDDLEEAEKPTAQTVKPIVEESKRKKPAKKSASSSSSSSFLSSINTDGGLQSVEVD